MADKIETLTLKGTELLSFTTRLDNMCPDAACYIDLDNQFCWSVVVKSRVTRESNAFFYQLKCSKENGNVELSDLVYIDFSQAIKTFPDGVEKIFTEGIVIKYENKVKHLFPFDKSASMSRKSVITFIDESLEKEMTDRLTLGIFDKEKNTPFSLSKVYAYRGLYLSSGTRIDLGKEVLNENTVVVIKDSVCTTRHEPVNVYTMDVENNIYIKKKYPANSKELDVNCFDGEGLIDPEFAGELGPRLVELGLRGADKASSYQIRLPYGKGVLHSVDFKRFLTEEIHCDLENTYINDYCNIKRKVKDIKIIMTQSMFKAHKWVKKAFYDPNDENCDPMRTYFEKFHELKHALYVLRTDKSMFNPGYISLNYQFLNTGKLSNEDFGKIVQKSITDYIDSVQDDYEKQRDLILGNYNPDSDMDDDEKTNSEDKKMSLLKDHHNLIHDKKIQGLLSGYLASEYINIMKGNIKVKGENRFLSGDLMFFLGYVAMLCVGEKHEGLRAFSEKLIKQELRPHADSSCLGGRFYAPVSSKNGIQFDKAYYAVLRNPHLSRNEQMAMKAYTCYSDDNLYYKYLHHLKGVLMLPYGSAEAERLGGADFDGDIVKVIDEDAFNKSARECCKEYPLVQIPHGVEYDKCIPDRVRFSDIKDGFDSRVGHISNLAIQFGEYEYNENINKIDDENKKSAAQTLKDELSSEDMDYAAASCIAVGMEIDKAKTGVSPDISILEAKKKDVKSDFLQNKDKLTAIRFKTPKLQDDGAFSYDKLKFEKPESGSPNLETLIYMVHAIKNEHKTEKKAQTNNARVQIFRSSKSQDLSNALTREVALRMTAFYRVLGISKAKTQFKKNFENTLYKRHIFYILKLQYDMEKDSINGKTINDVLEKTYRLIATYAGIIEQNEESKNDTRALLKEVVDDKWYYTPKSERRAKLEKWFSADKYSENYKNGEYSDDFEDAVGLLSNFTCKGYSILYYMLKDIIALAAKKNDFIEYQDELIDGSSISRGYVRKLKELMLTEFQQKYDRKFVSNKDREDFDFLSDMIKKKQHSQVDTDGYDDDEKRMSEMYDSLTVECEEVFKPYKEFYSKLDRSKRINDEDGRFDYDILCEKLGDFCRKDLVELFGNYGVDWNKAGDYWLSLRTVFDSNHDFMWSVFSTSEIEKLLNPEEKKSEVDKNA